MHNHVVTFPLSITVAYLIVAHIVAGGTFETILADTLTGQPSTRAVVRTLQVFYVK